MRGQLTITKLPVKMVNNWVLVSVTDTFSGFKTKGGIDLVNLTVEDTWGDSSQYNISEFVMRRGTVLVAPKVATRGSFNWVTDIETQTGDTVFWPLSSFQGHIPLSYEGRAYLMVDYHELIARQRGGSVTPLNGYGLFKPVEEIKKALAYTIKNKVSDDWVLVKKPGKNVVYGKGLRIPASHWEEGEKVKLLVRQYPYKLEGDIDKSLPEDLYACPMNYIICTA
jgi:hypothetical protein